MIGLALAAALAAAPACDRPLDVEVAAAPPVAGEQLARGVRLVSAWTLASPDPALGALARFDLAEGWAQTTDGRWLDWEMAPRPRAFRLACASLQASPTVTPPAPPDPPRIRGYQYVGSRPLGGSAFHAIGLWRSTEGTPETLVVAFDNTVRTIRAPYVVLVRTPQPLSAVSATGERGDRHLRIAAVTQGPPGAPVRLTEWSWRDGATYGVPLD